MKRTKKPSLVVFIILLLAIPLTVLVFQQVQRFVSHANISDQIVTVDMQQRTPFVHNWSNFAQGGEVPIPQLPSMGSTLSELHPEYVRLDHIYDAYKVVSKNSNGSFIYDFSLLDQEVAAITQAGAKPFLSLSYIPGDLAQKDHTERPNYTQWQDLVQKTVEHYSGKNNKNIQDVSYEVYNEPDLFGKWSKEEYVQLYEASAHGVQNARNTNHFYLGGPALSYLDKSFTTYFLSYVSSHSLPLDFISWHVYSLDPTKITTDTQEVKNELSLYPAFANTKIAVTEFGSYPQKHVWHDTAYDASHLVAVIASSRLPDQLFTFELKDGVNGQNEPFIGGWGLVTNEKYELIKKPKYFVFSLLDSLVGQQLAVSGVASPLYTLATSTDMQNMSVLLTHYDLKNEGKGQPTIHLTHLLPGLYSISEQVLREGKLQPTESLPSLTAVTNESEFTVSLYPQDVMLLMIQRSSPIAVRTQIPGMQNTVSAVALSGNYPITYIVPAATSLTTAFSFRPQKPLAQQEGVLFGIESQNQAVVKAEVKTEGFTPLFVITLLLPGGKQTTISFPAPHELPETFHTLSLSLDNQSHLLHVTFDNKTQSISFSETVALPDTVTFGQMLNTPVTNTVYIKQMKITSNGKPVVEDLY